MSRSTVVLPEPDGPSMAKNSPSAIRRSTPATAATVPKDLRSPVSWIAGTCMRGPYFPDPRLLNGQMHNHSHDPCSRVQFTSMAVLLADLAVLEVPYETPFLAVDRFVADQVTAESYRRQRELLEVHDALARALLSGGGLDRLLHVLGQSLGAPVAVVDPGGSVLSGDGA